MDKKKYVTVKALAHEIGRQPSAIYFWIDRGLIAVERRGLLPRSQIFIPIAEAERVKRMVASGELIEEM